MKNQRGSSNKYKNLQTLREKSQDIQDEIETEMAIDILLKSKTPLTAKAVQQQISALPPIAQQAPKKGKKSDKRSKSSIKHDLKNLKKHFTILKAEELEVEEEVKKVKSKSAGNLLKAEAEKTRHHIKNLHTRARRLRKEEKIAVAAEEKLMGKKANKAKSSTVRKALQVDSPSDVKLKQTRAKKELQKQVKRATAKAAKSRTQKDIDLSKAKTRKAQEKVPKVRSAPTYH